MQLPSSLGDNMRETSPPTVTDLGSKNSNRLHVALAGNKLILKRNSFRDGRKGGWKLPLTKAGKHC
jgi:hypothetical protein